MTVIVTPVGSGDVKVNGVIPPSYPAVYYADGLKWIFEAIPNPYFTFDHWTGFIAGSTNPFEYKVECGGTPTAYFSTKMNTVTGRMWKDTVIKNGIRDANELPVQGRVALFDAQGNQVGSWIRLDAQGMYSIAPPLPGQYFLRFLPLDAGNVFSPMNQGADATDSDVDPTGRTPGTFTVFLKSEGAADLILDAGVVPYTTNLKTMTEARTLMAATPNLLIVDVRDAATFCQAPGHLVCAKNVPFTGLVAAADFQALPTGRPVLVVGDTATDPVKYHPWLAASTLASVGYAPVYTMTQSMALWQDAYGPRLTCSGEYLTADAGGEVDACLNHPATLDGRASASPAAVGITGWQWVQTGGPAVSLSGAGTSQAGFTPTWTGPGPVDYTFSLTVTDACGGVDTDTVTVHATIAPGDYDGSGEVDLADAALVLKALAGMPLPENFLPEADPGPDPAVEMKDAIFILSRAAGLR